MAVDFESKDGQLIRQLIPLSTLSIDQFDLLCSQITVETAEPKTFLFKKNDIANDLIYLLEGSITLQSNDLEVETINSGTESSRFALAHQIPRKIDAVTNTAVRYLRIHTDIIESLSHNSLEKNMSNMAADETENNDDWMTALLKSAIFRALPPANIQKLIMSLIQVNYDQGDLIIRQGEPGDFYYIILKGQCMVSRKPAANAKEIKLAMLSNQDSFGEDSLITGEPRNVNITALTKTRLLRLSKDKFISLIKQPTLKFIPYTQISNELENGAVLLDVRTQDEFNKYHVPGSVNAPFFSLRMQIKTLNKKRKTLVICESGRISEAAAFILLRSRFNVFIVEGGINQERLETEDSVKSEPEDSNLDIESSDLMEQDPLVLENQRLKEVVQKLSSEKRELEAKYRNLYKQTEKIKSVLDTLKNNKPD